MNIIVCGSRNFSDYAFLKKKMDHLTSKLDMTPYKAKVVVFSGGAKGADKLGEQWAWERRLSYKVFKADFDKLGKKAGPIRNQEMIEAGADACVAFWLNRSPGTKDMIERAKKAGLKVKVYEV